MLGELIEVFKFILEIFKGNIPGTQLYTMIIIVGITFAGEVSYEFKKNKPAHIVSLLGERLLYNTLGILLYMGFYMFILRSMLLRVWPNLLPNYDTSTLSWLSIISYISIIILLPLVLWFYNTKQPTIRLFCLIIHPVLNAIILLLLNQSWEPQTYVHPVLLILNVLINTLISFVIVKYGSKKEENSYTSSNKQVTKQQTRKLL